jgi:hypothetical protein
VPASSKKLTFISTSRCSAPLIEFHIIFLARGDDGSCMMDIILKYVNTPKKIDQLVQTGKEKQGKEKGPLAGTDCSRN